MRTELLRRTEKLVNIAFAIPDVNALLGIIQELRGLP
jgi:hypothetical protein